MPEVPVRNDRGEPDVGLQLRRDHGQVQAPVPVGRGGQVPELSAKEATEEMRVYRYVTKDRYRLPVAQADSMGEPAALIGRSYGTVRRAMEAVYRGQRTSGPYEYVDLSDEEEEEDVFVPVLRRGV